MDDAIEIDKDFVKTSRETIRTKDIQSVTVSTKREGGGCAILLFTVLAVAMFGLGFTNPIFFLFSIAFLVTGFWGANRASKEFFELQVGVAGDLKMLGRSTDMIAIYEYKASIERVMAQTN